MVAQQILVGQLRDPPLFGEGHGFRRVPELPARTRLHLDEHQHGAVARDDVQFSTADPKTPGNNRVPAARQLLAREILAAFPERNAPVVHLDASQMQECDRTACTLTAGLKACTTPTAGLKACATFASI